MSVAFQLKDARKPWGSTGRRLPDPAARLSDMGSGHGRRWVKQKQCRAEILANARRLFARHGYDRFQLSEVAASCDLSTQTVYNLIGGRVQVINEATREHSLALVKGTAANSGDYPNFLLALADTFWAMAVQYPDYLREVMFGYSCSSRPLYDTIAPDGLGAIQSALVDLRSRGHLRERFDPNRLCGRLAAVYTASLRDWAEGFRDSYESGQDMVLGCGLTLMSAVIPREQIRIEDWLASVEARPA